MIDYATIRRTDAHDLLPYWALVEVALRDDLVSEDELVERSSEISRVVDTETDSKNETYRGLSSREYNTVLEQSEKETMSALDVTRSTHGPTPGSVGTPSSVRNRTPPAMMRANRKSARSSPKARLKRSMDLTLAK